MMSLDSAGTKNYVKLGDYQSIEEAFQICLKKATRYMGSGEKSGSTYDVGLEMPTFAELGVLEPDLDLDTASVQEPSADRTRKHLPDAPDTELVSKS